MINLIDWLKLDTSSLLGKDILNHITNLSLVCLVVYYINSEKKLDAAMRVYVLGSLLAIYIAAFSFVTGELPFEWLIRSFESELRESQRLMFPTKDLSVFRITSSFTDPSFYGLYICFVIILCIYLYYYVEKNKYIPALLFINFVALIGTLSRTALLGFAVIIAVSIFKIRRFWVQLAWLVPIIVFCSIFFYFNPEILNSLILYERFTDAESAIIRLNYIKNGLEVFIDNPIMGGGSELLGHGELNPSAHLVYLSILAKYGLIGFIIYAIFLLYPIYHVARHKDSLPGKYVYLITAVYSTLLVMYLFYDFFQFLEFQYLMFGFVYSIVLNRIGISSPSMNMKRLEAN
jgi:O-antigen ligase